MGLLQKLNSSPNLSKSAHKIAKVVLQQPREAINLPIAALAARAGVSEPSVLRFCQALGCKGYPDFKVQLAGELSGLDAKITRDVDAGDNIELVIQKLFDSTHASLSTAQNVCNAQELGTAIGLLESASAICFFGTGASGSVAQDAQHKFMRFQTPTAVHVDAVNQRIAAASLADSAVAVLISHSGRTRSIVEIASTAANTGASVVGITRRASPLAGHCDVVLPVSDDDHQEDTDIYTPMASRIAQLVIIDILATGMALAKGESFSDHLRNVKSTVAETKLGH